LCTFPNLFVSLRPKAPHTSSLHATIFQTHSLGRSRCGLQSEGNVVWSAAEDKPAQGGGSWPAKQPLTLTNPFLPFPSPTYGT